MSHFTCDPRRRPQTRLFRRTQHSAAERALDDAARLDRSYMARVAREYAAGAKTAEREHLFERLGVDSPQHEIGLQALADVAF